MAWPDDPVEVQVLWEMVTYTGIVEGDRRRLDATHAAEPVITFGGAVTHAVAAHLTGSGFAHNLPLVINWGDGTSTTAVTTSGSGTIASTAHTYAEAGTFHLVLNAGVHSAATLSQVVG